MADLSPATECEFFKEGFCRITGGACPHYAETYQECQTRRLATTGHEKPVLVIGDSQFAGLVSAVLSEKIRWEPYGTPWLEDMWVREDDGTNQFVDAITSSHIEAFRNIRDNPTHEDEIKFADTVAEYLRYQRGLGQEVG